MFYIRVPSPTLAGQLGCEVTRVTEAAGTYDLKRLPPPAFGWRTISAGLRHATYIETEAAARVLIHPKADTWRLRRVIDDLARREVVACLMGKRGPKFTNPANNVRVPASLEQGYFAAHSGKSVPLADFIAPLALSYSYRSEDMETAEHWAGGIRIG